jgi:predicted exporter
MSGAVGRRRLFLPLWLAFVAGCGWWAFARAPLNMEISQFISQTDPTARFLDEIGRSQGGRLVLIGIEGESEATLAAVGEHLRARLAASGLFRKVANGGEVLTAEDVAPLFERRYLLSPAMTTDRFTEQGLRAVLEENLRHLAAPVVLVERRLLPVDPTGEAATLQRLWQSGMRPPAKRHGVWFSADGRRALLAAETAATGFDPAAQRAALEAIRSGFDVAAAGTGAGLILGGLGALVADAQATVRSEAELLGLVGSLAVAAIMAFVYRSPRLVTLSLLPLVSAVMIAAAAVAAAFGTIYGIALGMGVTLLGVVVDYPVHLFSHLREGEAPARTAARLWPTLRLCVATTAAGYLFLATTEFTGLTQLALFSIVGVVVSAAVSRWLLPELLPRRWHRHHPIGRGRTLGALLRLRVRRPLALGAIGLAATAAVLVAAPPAWETDLGALSPIPEPLLAADRQLRADLGVADPGHLIVLRAPSPEVALQRSEEIAGRLDRLIAAGLIAGFQAPSTYLPSRQTQSARQAMLPEPAELERRLTAAAAGLPLKPGVFEPFVGAVARARGAEPVDLEWLDGTVIGPQVRSLLFRGDADWIALIPLAGVAEPERLAAALAPSLGGDARYVSVRAETNRLVAGFRDQALRQLAWGGLLYAVVLAAGVRSLRRMLAVTIPVALAVTLDLVVLAALGERLSLFHLLALLLVVGLGADYSLFFSADHADPDDRRRTLLSLVVGCGSTAALFGLLSLSSLQVLEAVGKTVATGVTFSFFMALLVARPLADQDGR